MAESKLQSIIADSPSPAVAAKHWLKEQQAKLDNLFVSKKPVNKLVNRRSDLVDEVLASLWRHLNLPESDMALIAVGGYGRGELHPQSDVDILVLHRNPLDENVSSAIEGFITQCWDLGLDIGHSVRSLEDCVEQALADITIATNLMECRVISGEEALLNELRSITGPDRLWNSLDFFEAKWNEQKARHRKHNHTEYNVEPDIKNAPGGLRDIQMVGWIAKRHFGVNNLKDLVNLGVLTEAEYRTLDRGQSFLWAVRWALHMQTNSNENRLLFDYQRAIAAQFGYQDSNANLAVEQFMKQYYRTALELSVINEMLLQYFDEVILHEGDEEVIEPINERFQIRNGYIEVTDGGVFRNTPSALLEIFLIMAQRTDIVGPRSSTVRLLVAHRGLIDDDFRNAPENILLFRQLLNAPHKIFSQLRRMKRYGILGKYIPAFGQIIGLMQYDLFHIYTVDAHTLLVFKNMRRLGYPENREKFPVAYSVMQQIERKEILYIAGLFHDIAKGRGGDHSELGADEAVEFCLHHGLSMRDAQLVAWLVRSHLIMSTTAQRKDLSDPDVIHDFAKQVGDIIHLNYLYALTVADINGTNPELWNGWRASLMRQLYNETKRALRRGLSNPIDKKEWVEETRSTALAILSAQQIDIDDIEQLWQHFSDEYFLRENAVDVAWHTEAILRHHDDSPLVLTKRTTASHFEGATQVFVYSKDKPKLFAATTTCLSNQCLSIVDARIITTNHGYSADTYFVLDEEGSSLHEESARNEDIQNKLIQMLSAEQLELPNVQSRIMPRTHKHFDVRTQTHIDKDPYNDQRSVVELVCIDQPGLLAKVGQVFVEFNLNVHNAKISTLGERAEDIFFVSTADDQALNDQALCGNIDQRLKEVLQTENNTPDGEVRL